MFKLSLITIIQFVLIASCAATFGWGQGGDRGNGGSTQCSTCSNHFGQASQLNLYSCRDLNLGGCSSDGAVGCGGSLNVPSSFSCNRNNIKQTPYSLCVGGNLAVSGSLQVRGGGVYYGRSQTGNVQFTSQGSLSNGVSPISYDASTAQLQSLSQYWSTLSSTGSTTYYSGQLWFTCSSSTTQVFSVSGSALSTYINFYRCSSTHTIIINVYGSSASLSNSVINYGGLDPSQIVLNFYQSTSLQLSGCSMPSTILAPRSSCTGWNSKVGQLFAWSFSASSSFQFVAQHNNNSCWFDRCVPVPCTMPTVPPTVAPTQAPTPVPVTTTPTPVIVPPPYVTSGNCTVCTNIFQNLSSLNFFSCSHSQLGGCSSQGPVGCGGNLRVPNSLSCGNSGSNAKFAVAVAGILSILGSVNVNGGNIWYGGSQSGTVSFNTPGSLTNGLALNFNASASILTSYASFWAGLRVTGSTNFFWGTTTLTCSSATTQVFSISGNALSSWYTINFANCNAGQTIIVGVTGGSITLSNVNLNLGSLSASQVIFNFHQCTSLQIAYAQFPATIIAPYASCTGSNSRVGQLFVGWMTTSLSFNFFSSWGGNSCWFNRCVPVPCGTKTTVAPTTPAPTTIATTAAPTTVATTAAPTTQATTAAPTTQATTAAPTTAATTAAPTTQATTAASTTAATTAAPTTVATTAAPTTQATTAAPTTQATTAAPTTAATTAAPTTQATTAAPTTAATTAAPTTVATTAAPTTVVATTAAPTVRQTTPSPVTTNPPTTPPTVTNSPPSEGTNPPSVALTVPPVTTVAATIPPTTRVVTSSAPTTRVATTKQATIPITTQPRTTQAATTRPATTQAVTQPATTAAPTTVAVTVPPTTTPTLPPPSDECDDNGCLGGYCCAGMCYDPSRQNCVSTPNGSVLCGFQEHGPDAVCGGFCYDNISYVCCGNTIYGRKDANIPCAAPPNPYANDPLVTCGGIQCDEPGYLCCNQTAGSAGPSCYWPTAQSCFTGSKGPILCGIHDKPCGTVCYNALQYTCVNDALVQLSN